MADVDFRCKGRALMVVEEEQDSIGRGILEGGGGDEKFSGFRAFYVFF